MKHTIQTKVKHNATVASQQNSPEANAASIVPPSYGMDFLDNPAKQPNRTGLPDKLKTGIENLSGLSMDAVRVHYNSGRPAQLNALAYTQGTDIHVASGQEQHLPHEAWHVVQQAQGRVKPTMQMKEGVTVNDDKGLEHEADAMGEKAINQVTPLIQNKTTVGFENSQFKTLIQKQQQQIIQMKWEAKDEEQAQKKLLPIHDKVIKVPTKNVLDQQAWAGLNNYGKAVQVGKNKFDLLQAIDADKVIARAAQIMEGKVTVEPPPVAFSTETAIAANPDNAELVLLDSHHTVNAARILRGEETIPVLHNAKPDVKGSDTIAQIAASRETLTKNKNTAKTYNQAELGQAALQQAQKEIMKLKTEKRLAEDSHKARSYDFKNASDLKFNQ